MLPNLASPTTVLLERYLDVLAARQRVTASNIANADTPGFRAREIDFRFEMQSLTVAPRHAVFFPAMVRETAGEGAKNDGNTVSLDRELLSLSENGMRFQVASLLLRHQLRGVMNAVREGRGSL
jgi:flagellar basal-body rod protein FlgB